MALIGGMGIELERYPDIRRQPEVAKIEVRLQDPNDHIGIAAQRDGLTDDRGIGGKAPLPEAVAENNHFVAARQILRAREGAPAIGLCAEEAEVTGAHLCRLQLLRDSASGQVHHAGPECGDVLENAGLFAPMLELGGRGGGSGALRGSVHQQDQPFRVGERGGLQQHRVDDREDRRIRSDSQGESRYRRGGEAGALPQEAKRVPDVLDQRFHAD